MNKVTLLMATAILTVSLLAMFLAPTTTITNSAKAYSCSSSSSAGAIDASSRINGFTGSCATSSSSSYSSFAQGQAPPNPCRCTISQTDSHTGPAAPPTPIKGSASSSSSGGGQSSSSSSLSNRDFALAFSQSNFGSTVATPPQPITPPTTTSTTNGNGP